MEEARRCLVFDPRVGLALLVFANLAAFSEQPFWMEMTRIGFLLFLMLLHRCFAMAGTGKGEQDGQPAALFHKTTPLKKSAW